jgi:hypothetical protein
MTRKMVIVFPFAVCLSFAAGYFWKPPTPCQKLKGKIEVAHLFCEQVSKDFAQDSCEQQTDDPRLVKVCVSLIAPTIQVKCLDKVGIEKMKTQEENFCTLANK